MSDPAHVLIFGATGMVGIEVLHRCLDDGRIGRVTCVVRRSTEVTNDKLTEIFHDDYLDYRALEDTIRTTDVCLYCIGVYQGMLPEDQFWIVTCDYLRALIETIEAVRPTLTFCLFSAQGADPSERSRVLFAKAKGRAERLLTQSAIERSYVFRPGYINPGRRTATSRIPPWLVKPFFALLPFIGVEAHNLAAVMVDTGLDGAPQPVFENRDIRRHIAARP